MLSEDSTSLLSKDYPSRRSSRIVTPTYLIKGVFFILVLTSLWSIILPGILAWNDRVFFDHQIISKMPPNARKEYEDYAKQKATLEVLAVDLTNWQPGSQNLGRAKDLLDFQKQLIGTKNALRCEIHPIAR
jgi:hypothetical protein